MKITIGLLVPFFLLIGCFTNETPTAQSQIESSSLRLDESSEEHSGISSESTTIQTVQNESSEVSSAVSSDDALSIAESSEGIHTSSEEESVSSMSSETPLLKKLVADDSYLTSHKVTFAVDTVKPVTTIIPAEPYEDVVLKTMITDRNTKDIKSYTNKMGDRTSPFADVMPDSIGNRIVEATAFKDITLVPTRYHGFMAGLRKAYADHYTFVISPDMIWLMISQGFATHVNQNAEELRSQFVDFNGKKALVISLDPYTKGDPSYDWPSAFAEFSDSIETNTGAELLDLVTGDFSTTTPMEKASFQVTLMDAMQNYFMYVGTSMCGIPYITLEGTTADWELIRTKAEALRQYDLEWWIDDLLPLLDQFIVASKGDVDRDFWKSIYIEKKIGCGSTTISGWILMFFPYLENDSKPEVFLKDNVTLDMSSGVPSYEFTYGTETSSLPSGLSQAPMLLDCNGTFFNMELIAGFSGFRQDLETGALRPEISWAVADLQTKPSAEDIETYHNGGDADYFKD